MSVPRTPLSQSPRVRNDDALNTGMSSALERRVHAKQQELHNKRAAEKARAKAQLSSLTTQGEFVIDMIDDEIANVSDIRKMVTEFDMKAFMENVPLAKRMNISSAELLQAQTIARIMHVEFLEKLRKRAKNVMKEPKQTVKDGDSFEEGK